MRSPFDFLNKARPNTNAPADPSTRLEARIAYLEQQAVVTENKVKAGFADPEQLAAERAEIERLKAERASLNAQVASQANFENVETQLHTEALAARQELEPLVASLRDVIEKTAPLADRIEQAVSGHKVKRLRHVHYAGAGAWVALLKARDLLNEIERWQQIVHEIDVPPQPVEIVVHRTPAEDPAERARRKRLAMDNSKRTARMGDAGVYIGTKA